MFHIVLHEPEIPPNTGNVIRLCANTGATLHLVKPLGFRLDAKAVRRAGLDYRELADVRVHASVGECLDSLGQPRWFVFTTRATLRHDAARFEAGDALVFGAETRGLPQAVLDACPEVHKWAIYERDPMPAWGRGNVVLLGDACHAMTPYMAQGAASAIEDAAVLTRCLDDSGDPAEAFARFAKSRQERTGTIQLTSHKNEWLSKRTDPDWVYGYDAWTTPLAPRQTVAA
jgi:tRNA (cytidine(34)-2'-O)-methyltransferase